MVRVPAVEAAGGRSPARGRRSEAAAPGGAGGGAVVGGSGRGRVGRMSQPSRRRRVLREGASRRCRARRRHGFARSSARLRRTRNRPAGRCCGPASFSVACKLRLRRRVDNALFAPLSTLRPPHAFIQSGWSSLGRSTVLDRPRRTPSRAMARGRHRGRFGLSVACQSSGYAAWTTPPRRLAQPGPRRGGWWRLAA